MICRCGAVDTLHSTAALFRSQHIFTFGDLESDCDVVPFSGARVVVPSLGPGGGVQVPPLVSVSFHLEYVSTLSKVRCLYE